MGRRRLHSIDMVGDVHESRPATSEATDLLQVSPSSHAALERSLHARPARNTYPQRRNTYEISHARLPPSPGPARPSRSTRHADSYLLFKQAHSPGTTAG